VSNAAAAAELPADDGIDGIPVTTDSDMPAVVTAAVDSEKTMLAKVSRKTSSQPVAAANDVDSGDEDELKPVPPQGLLCCCCCRYQQPIRIVG